MDGTSILCTSIVVRTAHNRETKKESNRIAKFIVYGGCRIKERSKKRAGLLIEHVRCTGISRTSVVKEGTNKNSSKGGSNRKAEPIIARRGWIQNRCDEGPGGSVKEIRSTSPSSCANVTVGSTYKDVVTDTSNRKAEPFKWSSRWVK